MAGYNLPQGIFDLIAKRGITLDDKEEVIVIETFIPLNREVFVFGTFDGDNSIVYADGTVQLSVSYTDPPKGNKEFLSGIFVNDNRFFLSSSPWLPVKNGPRAQQGYHAYLPAPYRKRSRVALPGELPWKERGVLWLLLKKTGFLQSRHFPAQRSGEHAVL